MGMRPNDLNGLLSNKMTIDEYSSKIDDASVVVTFSVFDRYAAQDANRFIQKSYIEILDSDVSAASDAQGYYTIFVELQNNPKAPDAIQELCNDLKLLGNIEEWDISFRGVGMVNTPYELVAKTVEEHLKPYVYKIEESCTLVKPDECQLNNWKFSLIDIGDTEVIINRNNLFDIEQLEDELTLANIKELKPNFKGIFVDIKAYPDGLYLITNESENVSMVISALSK